MKRLLTRAGRSPTGLMIAALVLGLLLSLASTALARSASPARASLYGSHGISTPVGRGHSNGRTSHATPSGVVGYAYFYSSGQLNESMTQGYNDELLITLRGIDLPAPGTAYYAWLLSDRQATLVQPVALGQVTYANQAWQAQYSDPAHRDLLASMSRVLVTQEEAAVTPLNPSLDSSAWKYFGAFSTLPDPADSEYHFSVLDHIRHLLTNLSLKDMGSMMPVVGGLRLPFFMNTRKVFEWAVSARGSGMPEPAAPLRRNLYRILDYLDGSMLVARDVPAGTPLYVDPALAQVGLLELSPQQQPAAYVVQIGLHLAAIAQNTNATPGQREVASAVTAALDQVAAALGRVRNDAKQLLALSDDQLMQPSGVSVLDDLVEQSSIGYLGTLVAESGERMDGAVYVADQLQHLASLPISRCDRCTL